MQFGQFLKEEIMLLYIHLSLDINSNLKLN